MLDTTQKFIAHIAGGLGNQLFKIAGALKIASGIEENLYLDLSWFDYQDYYGKLGIRKFEASYFPKVSLLKSTSKKRVPLLNNSRISSKFDFFNSLPYAYFPIIRKVRHIRGDFEDLSQLPNDQVLRDFFAFPTYKSPFLAKRLSTPGSRPRIAVHVRRGDFLEFKELYDVLSPSYYIEAVKHVKSIFDNPQLVLFSDEPASALDFLRGAIVFDSVVDPEEMFSSAEILEYMSNFQGIILANSTFSWWAATLGELNATCTAVVIPDQFNTLRSTESRLFRTGWKVLPSH